MHARLMYMHVFTFFFLSLSLSLFFDKRHMNGSVQNPINLNLLKSVYGVKKKKKKKTTETSQFPNHPNEEI